MKVGNQIRIESDSMWELYPTLENCFRNLHNFEAERDLREKLVPVLYVTDEKWRLQELPVVTEHLGAIPSKHPSLLTLCSADLTRGMGKGKLLLPPHLQINSFSSFIRTVNF